MQMWRTNLMRAIKKVKPTLGLKKTQAKYYVKDTEAVRDLLSKFTAL